MRIPLRYLLTCLLIWLVPFVASVPFYNGNGSLRVPFVVFKATMVVVLCGVTWAMFRWLYHGYRPPRTWQAAALGLGAVAAGVALDSVTVLPLTGMGWRGYVLSIGVWYLLIVALSYATWLRAAHIEEAHADKAHAASKHRQRA